MFNIQSCHLMQFPSKRWGYVGRIPICLGDIVPADVHAVLGGRTFTDDEGKTMMFKARTFETEEQARKYAVTQGVTLA